MNRCRGTEQVTGRDFSLHFWCGMAHATRHAAPCTPIREDILRTVLHDRWHILNAPAKVV